MYITDQNHWSKGSRKKEGEKILSQLNMHHLYLLSDMYEVFQKGTVSIEIMNVVFSYMNHTLN